MVWVLEKWNDPWRCENLVDEEHGLCIIYDSRFPGIIMYTLAYSLAFANTQLKDDIIINYLSDECVGMGDNSCCCYVWAACMSCLGA